MIKTILHTVEFDIIIINQQEIKLYKNEIRKLIMRRDSADGCTRTDRFSPLPRAIVECARAKNNTL